MLHFGFVSTLSLLLAALGLAMFIEGLPYFAWPGGVRRYLEQLARLSDRTLRTLGLVLMVCGLLIAYFSLH